MSEILKFLAALVGLFGIVLAIVFVRLPEPKRFDILSCPDGQMLVRSKGYAPACVVATPPTRD